MHLGGCHDEYKGMIFDRCGVKVTAVRGSDGHIEDSPLQSSTSFFEAMPSRLGTLWT